ncbi:outer membrane protein transport protein [bacterium]|nr:outer membrane protein transport protein [bacterium]
MKKKRLFIILWAAAAGIRPAVSGDTDWLYPAGASVLSRNGLLIAGTGESGNVPANPAALAFMQGTGMEASLLIRSGRQEYSSPDHGYYRSFIRNRPGFSGFVYGSPMQKLVFAVLYGPLADFHVEWPFAMVREKEGNAFVEGFEMTHRLEIRAIAPTVAFRAGRAAFGFAADFYDVYQRIAFPLASPDWLQGRGLPGYQFSFSRDARAFGFHAGLTLDLSGRIRFGAGLRSGFSADLEGKASTPRFVELDTLAGTTDLAGSFEMPWILGCGMVFRATEKLEFNLDAMAWLWSGVGQSMSFIFKDGWWQDSLSVRDSYTGISADRMPMPGSTGLAFGLGCAYAVPGGWILRFGYRFQQSPNTVSTFSMLMPEVDRHWISAGLGWSDGKYRLDAALAYGFGVSREAAESGNPVAAGLYDSKGFVPSLTVRVGF